MPTKLFVANGKSIFVNKQAEITITIEHRKTVCDVLVARELLATTDLILGTDWFRKHRAILNFDDNTMTFDDTVTAFCVRSDKQDLLSLSDFTKLEPGKATTVKVKVPTRFNNCLIEVGPAKPNLREGLIVERSVHQAGKYVVHIMLINVSNEIIYLPQGMNVATCEIIKDTDLTAISDLQADSPPTFKPRNDNHIIDFSRNSNSIHDKRSNAGIKLNANATPF